MVISPVSGVSFELLPQKAILWKEENTLIVSDIHIGKGGHFRKNGIAMPKETDQENLWKLSGLLLDHKPDRLLLLGDLFHSRHNHEWERFCDMLKNFPELHIDLVLGNHDILEDHHFANTSIHRTEELVEMGMHFTHEPIEVGADAKGYNCCGHIHPAYILRGRGRQSLRLPCFWCTSSGMILPAFGSFTGMHAIRPKKSDEIFAVTNEAVIRV